MILDEGEGEEEEAGAAGLPAEGGEEKTGSGRKLEETKFGKLASVSIIVKLLAFAIKLLAFKKFTRRSL